METEGRCLKKNEDPVINQPIRLSPESRLIDYCYYQAFGLINSFLMMIIDEVFLVQCSNPQHVLFATELNRRYQAILDPSVCQATLGF